MILFDRFKASIAALIRELTAQYDYSGVHGYTVVSQNGDFTLELKPDDPEADPPLSGVVIKYDSPSNRVTVKAGVTCNVMFTNKDPSRPFAFGFDPGDYTLLEFGPDARKIARAGDLTLGGGIGCMALLTPLPGNVSPSVLPGIPYLVSFGTLTNPPLPATAVLQGKLPGRILTGSNKNLG